MYNVKVMNAVCAGKIVNQSVFYFINTFFKSLLKLMFKIPFHLMANIYT